ncbi:MAG: glycoside hydrolase family 5 protein [Nitrososphaerota archaeon]|nr:glycoside hydrolase family 5 protein [Nitrososphaerota archaeon]
MNIKLRKKIIAIKIFTYLVVYLILFNIVNFNILVLGVSNKGYFNETAIPLLNVKMRRGINIGNALEAPREGEWGVYIMDEYFSIIRDAGFDTVRIPIRWSAHAEENPPFNISKEFFNRVDHVVKVALKQNLTTIINIHHYEEIMYEPDKHRERLISLWKQISEHYRDYPENLYFELLNEPHGALTDDIWNDLLRELVKVIRETNPTRKIIIGPTNWNSVYKLKDLKLPKDDNIIVTFHFYTPFEFTHQGAEWVEPLPPVGVKWKGTDDEKRIIKEELDIAAKWAEENNFTLLMGEFGAYSKADMESRIRWTSFVAREAEKRKIAWCYWEFCSGFGAYDPVKREWRKGLLEALISGKHYVSVESEHGGFSGAGWYEEGSYALIRVVENGFFSLNVFDHFEGLEPNDRIIDNKTVEIYVSGPRLIKVVWKINIMLIFILIVIIMLLFAVLMIKVFKKL